MHNLIDVEDESERLKKSHVQCTLCQKVVVEDRMVSNYWVLLYVRCYGVYECTFYFHNVASLEQIIIIHT